MFSYIKSVFFGDEDKNHGSEQLNNNNLLIPSGLKQRTQFSQDSRLSLSQNYNKLNKPNNLNHFDINSFNNKSIQIPLSSTNKRNTNVATINLQNAFKNQKIAHQQQSVQESSHLSSFNQSFINNNNHHNSCNIQDQIINKNAGLNNYQAKITQNINQNNVNTQRDSNINIQKRNYSVQNTQYVRSKDINNRGTQQKGLQQQQPQVKFTKNQQENIVGKRISIINNESETQRQSMSNDFKRQSEVTIKNQKNSQNKPPSGLKQKQLVQDQNPLITRNINVVNLDSSNQFESDEVIPIQSQDDEISINEYQKMRAGLTGPEAPTVPQSAYISILGSGFSNQKEIKKSERSQEKSSFVILNMHKLKHNTIQFQAPLVSSDVDIEQSSYMKNEYYHQQPFNLGSTQKLPLLEPYLSKAGDQMVASRQAFDDSSLGGGAEDRKETEQLPITKDMLLGMNSDIDAMIGAYNANNVSDIYDEQDEDIDDEGNNTIHLKNRKSRNGITYDSSEENGVEVEFNEVEKTVAQKSIRRSVVKDKLNWSCQFGKGVLSKNTKTLDGIQKLFMDSRGAQHAVNSLKNKRQYHISQNALLFELSMPNKDLKFISVNMLCKNLKIIDLQNNKLESLPEEISDLMFLEKLKVDNNNLKSLPQKLSYLNMLQTLTICNNQISELPEGIEELTKLEILLLNDNKLSKLTPRIGYLQNLKKLFLHNNQFQEIPVQIYKLTKLKEFSSEWFLYLKPPMPRIMRDQQGLIIIEKIKQFCKAPNPYTLQNNNLNDTNRIANDYKSFADFILYYYKVKPQDINNLQFGQKQRGLIHQICINQHPYLLQNIMIPQPHQYSAHLIYKHLDLNLKDKEGSTAICFAFRQGQDDILNVFMNQDTMRLDLNMNTLKYGTPLHMCILKHKFQLAIDLIDQKNVNPHALNANGSNAMHVLFANYMYDEGNGEKLAQKLIQRQVNINLVDTNGLTPIHVAIKKLQTKALEFAQFYNILIQQTNTSQSNAIVPQNRQQIFDFNAKGKKKLTPLHYSITKTNFESFLFLLNQNLSDIWALDDQYRTPRSVALINSAFYKILFRMEMLCMNSKAFLIREQLEFEKIQNQLTVRDENQNRIRKGSYNQHSNIWDQKQDQPKDFFKKSMSSVVKVDGKFSKDEMQHLNLTRRYLHNLTLVQQNEQSKSKMLFLKKKHLISLDQSKQQLQQTTNRASLKKVDKIQNDYLNNTNNNQKKQSFEYKQKQPLINIAHHQNMPSADDTKQQQMMQANNDNKQNQVNNIFISNLNINVNLNINISIPPSPLSTKGNGSRLESHASQEELKDQQSIRMKQKKIQKPLQSHRYNNNATPNYFNDDNLQNNASMRYEDLSVIDDEMPIHNKINKNFKPDEIQGIIQQIQPEIYKGLTQSLTNKNNCNSQASNNNIFINMCSINNPAQTERQQEKPEDIESSIIKPSPRKLNNSKIFQNQQSSSQDFQEQDKQMRKNFSMILQEEPIHNCHINQQESSIKQFNSNQSLNDKTFMSYLSNQKYCQTGDKELQDNKFFKEYLILCSENESMSTKYQVLYHNIALCQLAQDENIIKDALIIILKVIKQISYKNPLINELLYLLGQLANFNNQASQYLKLASQYLISQENQSQAIQKTAKCNQLLAQMELMNGQINNEIRIQNQPKYPQISSKLNQYLQQNNKRGSSNHSRSDNKYIKEQPVLNDKYGNKKVEEYKEQQNQIYTNRMQIKNHLCSSDKPNHQSNQVVQINNQQNSFHQRQLTNEGNMSQRNKNEKKKINTRPLQNNQMQILDDTTVVTERLGGTMKLSQLKIINSQAHTVLSPAIKDNLNNQKLTNFSSVKQNKVMEQAKNKTHNLKMRK